MEEDARSLFGDTLPFSSKADKQKEIKRKIQRDPASVSVCPFSENTPGSFVAEMT